MKRPLFLAGSCAAALLLLTLAGCSTLNVTTPNGMFLSTGDDRVKVAGADGLTKE